MSLKVLSLKVLRLEGLIRLEVLTYIITIMLTYFETQSQISTLFLMMNGKLGFQASIMYTYVYLVVVGLYM